MRKINKILIAALGVLAIVGCQKEIIPTNVDNNDTSILIASTESRTKVNITDNGREEGTTAFTYTWQNNSSGVDAITIYNAETGKAVGDYTYSGVDDSSTGTFTSDDLKLTENNKYIAVYPASSLIHFNNRNISNITHNSQKQGQEGNIGTLNNAVRMIAEFTYDGSVPQLFFTNEMSMATIDIAADATLVPLKLVFKDGDEEDRIYTINYEGVTAGEDITTHIAMFPNPSTETRTLSFTLTYVSGEVKIFEVETSKAFLQGVRYTMPINGQLEDVLYINSVAKLKAFRNEVNSGNSFLGKTVIITKDINLSNINNWEPIGNSISNPFSGTFDGGGYTIKNINITSSNPNAGLFGVVKDNSLSVPSKTGKMPTIKNLNIENARVYGDNSCGAIVGSADGARITNCNVISSEIGTTAPTADQIEFSASNIIAGGIVGKVLSSIITSCSTNCSVVGREFIGGIAGISADSDIINCNSAGLIFGNNRIGGILGGTTIQSDAPITINPPIFDRCYSTSTIGIGGSSSEQTAGLVGEVYGKLTVSNCYFAGTITNESTAGIANVTGRNISITSCYNIATTKTSITTPIANAGDISNCFFLGEITSDTIEQPSGITPVIDIKELNSLVGNGLDNSAFSRGLISTAYAPSLNGEIVIRPEITSDIISITSAEQFAKIQEMINSGVDFIHCRLDANIKFNETNSISISNFNGFFDGNGYTISGWSGTTTDDAPIALFKNIPSTLNPRTSAYFMNLTIDDFVVNGVNNVAALIGTAETEVAIVNCKINYSKIIASGDNAGAFIANNNSNFVLITKCSSLKNTVTANNNAGGFIGSNNDNMSYIIEAINSSAVTAINDNAAGIVGNGTSEMAYIACENSGKIKANNYAAGISVSHNATLEGILLINSGAITAKLDNAAGIVAGSTLTHYDNGLVSCYSTVKPTAKTNGYPISSIIDNMTIIECYYVSTSDAKNVQSSVVRLKSISELSDVVPDMNEMFYDNDRINYLFQVGSIPNRIAPTIVSKN